ncbi:MAG: polysaccharide pyruvyl transferase family protein [Clostridium butyricum]|uniref:polysaccharide pyruvyl transferase family protein n=1 Tax=Clostridium butyricum TaxID=1492 RepID=UPI00290546E3|nr:polysaccharide pyruvyl transferase family protein [Clostridium butyricum]MDU3582833.1 polysaccharide pyruvyl transferase family protein [Clostridium butyricum]MDU3595950.1 polysaccharide pyruvyl transferase family protein [Clostridium butyricum]
MKVGILTFHNAHNYGAVLQAYALKKKISELGHNVEIVNYRNENIDKRYEKKLRAGISLKDFKYPRQLINKISYKKNVPYMQPAWEKQCEKFTSFINMQLLNSKSHITIDDLKKSNYDVLIVGSDQVWSSWITDGLDPVYLLDFKFNGRKISYAASLMGGSIDDSEKDYFIKCLQDFDYISVREDSLRKSVIETCKCDAVTVLDPTLLINSESYEEIESKELLFNERFIFAYFVSENVELMRCAEKLAKESGFKLLELHYYMQKKYDDHNQIADIGPAEFLWYIKNSEYVITNSFHGTVFSILYKKNFYSVYEKNARINNLLEALKLEDRHAVNSNEIDFNRVINFENVDRYLNNFRESSIGFLKKSLSNVGEI